MESGLILLLVFCVFSVCIDLSGYLRAKTDTERGMDDNIDCQKKREFKRIFSRCKRKWAKDKDLSLHRQFGSLDNYIDTEYSKLYDWERLYYESEYK